MIGAQLGSYRILEELGKGGMGTVYKAVDTSLDRMVAVKVLSSDYSTNPELVERFRLEARAQANLNHTNIAMLHAFIAEAGQAWMVMELIDGETIAQMLMRRGLLPPNVAVPLFKQALLGIGYAHRAGIVHRDLKPSNLMVNKDGIVKVMDFGIAKVIGSRGLTRTGTALGTAYYMSPEQVMNRTIDIRSDIYSLGVTLYEMLTANVPFQGDSDFQILSAHMYTPPPPPTQFYPYIPKPIEEAVLKAMAKEPNARFQTVEEFGVALEHFEMAGAPAPSPVVGVPPPPPPAGTPPRGFTPVTPIPSPVVIPPVQEPPQTGPRGSTFPPMPPPATGPGMTVVPPPPPPPQNIAQVQAPAPKPVALISTPKGKLMLGGAVAVVAAMVLLTLPRHGGVVTPPPPPPQHDEIAPPPNQQQQQQGKESGVVIPPLDGNTAAPGLKVVSFVAAPKRIAAGQKARLSWSVQGASQVAITPSVGVVSADGTRDVAVDHTTEFTLTARTITGDEVTGTVTVVVGPSGPSAPADLAVAFDAQPATIASGQSTVLRWSAPGAQSIRIEPGVGVVPAPAGTRQVSPANTMSYSLVARGGNGAVGAADVTVTVLPKQEQQPPKPPVPSTPVTPVVSLMATPNPIYTGGSTTLVWSIKNAVSANISPAPGPLKQTVGQYSVSPESTTTYTLTARSQDGTTASANTIVQVMPRPQQQVPNPPPPITSTNSPPAPGGAATPLIAVVHDHGVLNQYAWPSCWGTVQIANGMIRYVVIGTNDGRRDDFSAPIGQVQEIKLNRLRIRNQPAFHVQFGKQHFNFVPTGMAAAAAANTLEAASQHR